MADLPSLIPVPGDLLVVNTTRVLPARLRLRKATGGAAEGLPAGAGAGGGGGAWEALVRPGRRLPPGTASSPTPRAVRRAAETEGGASGEAMASMASPGDDVVVEVGDVLGEDGRRLVRLHLAGGARGADAELAALERHGSVPLPPYITEPLADAGRYQTVYADRPGSVAAPTAGLHLTDAVLDGCRAAGAGITEVELVVGLGAFRPIATDKVEDHTMHGELRGPRGDAGRLRSGRPGGGRGDDRGPGAGVGRRHGRAQWADRAVHPPALAVAGGRRPAHQLPHAPLVAARAGRRLRRAAVAGSTPRRWPRTAGSCPSATVSQ